MKRMKNDTAHYDASTVLSTLKMLSTEMNILVPCTPPKKSLHFWLFIFGSNFILVFIMDDHHINALLYYTSAERSLQGKE